MQDISQCLARKNLDHASIYREICLLFERYIYTFASLLSYEMIQNVPGRLARLNESCCAYNNELY